MMTSPYAVNNFGEPDASSRTEWASLSYLLDLQTGGSHAPGVVIGVTFDKDGRAPRSPIQGRSSPSWISMVTARCSAVTIVSPCCRST